MSPDNGVTSVHVVLLVKVMHGSAQPFGNASSFSEQLRHALIQIGAPSNGVPVVTVCGNDEIIISGGCHSTYGYCFLADIEVAKTAYLLLLIGLRSALFEAAYKQHNV